MSSRLEITKVCPICGHDYRPFIEEQKTCSRRCGARWRHQHLPQTCAMHEANAANRKAFLDQRKKELAHLTPVEAYGLGRKDGYSLGRQRRIREVRETA